MKKLLLVAAAALLASTPANATGGLLCSTAGARNVSLALVVSHTAVPSIVSARLTDGGRKKSAPISLRTLSEQTGLSKRAIQDASDRLERRQLISIERQMPTAVPVYRLHKPWVR